MGGTGGAPESAASGPRARIRRRSLLLRYLGQVFRGGTTAVAVAAFVLILTLGAVILQHSLLSMERFGWGFLTDSVWDLHRGVFGAAPAIAGTLFTSAFALLIAVPVALGVAILSSEMAPRRLRGALGYFVDFGAAIPSVVYGFWALEVLSPFIETRVEPGLVQLTDGGFPFSGSARGLDLVTASVILAIMIIPTIAAFSREALKSVPRSQREAILSLGGTRWEATRKVVLGPATPGIAGGIVLGLGRAIGETIAVAMVIGGIYRVPSSLLSGATTIPATLVTGFTDSAGLEQSAFYELGLILLALSLSINIGARLLLRRVESGEGRSRARSRHLVHAHPSARRIASVPAPGGGFVPPAWWSGVMARRSSRLFRRKVVHAVVVVLVVGALIVAAYPLVSLLRISVENGGTAVVRPSFYTSEPPVACGINASCPLGGIGPAIQGTLVLLALAAALGLPFGILTGIYLSEYGRHRFGRTMALAIDVLAGVPTILIGVFVFGLFLQFDRLDARSAIAGAVALSVLMLPIVAKATETALGTVSRTVRESALALGFPRHRVTVRVVLGSCRSALVTGSLLALMRAGGETAALIVTAGSSQYWLQSLHSPTAALAPFIYLAWTSFSSRNYTIDAWGAALVLVLIMAVVSLAARLSLRTETAGGPE